MPYEWLRRHDGAPAHAGAFALDGTFAELRLWPHRSLTNRGFATFIGATCALFLVPLVGLLGQPALWAILPFILLAVGGTWLAIRRSDRDRSLSEVMQLSPERLTVIRRDRDGRERKWETNPYWVSVRLHATAGPVPNYLTLKGTDREVELGAFLSEAERLQLRDELSRALAGLAV